MSLKIAALCTTYFPWSHADVIVTRWLDPHPHDAVVGFRPQSHPQSHIASLYVAQKPGGVPVDGFMLAPRLRQTRFDPSFDISQQVAQTYSVPTFTSIHQALTLGTGELAVDAVLLIGEHGDYDLNEFGQKLYPRKERWDEVLKVFRESKRVVPVFSDKHLSWNMDWATEIVQTARELGIPLFAGSSVPITGPKHPLYLPPAPEIDESLGLFYVVPKPMAFTVWSLCNR